MCSLPIGETEVVEVVGEGVGSATLASEHDRDATNHIVRTRPNRIMMKKTTFI